MAAPQNAFIALIAEQQKKDAVEVWPENWPIFALFASLQTQWRVAGMGGPVGLDYAALYPLLDRLTSDPAEWHAHFEDVREMESAALDAMREKTD